MRNWFWLELIPVTAILWNGYQLLSANIVWTITHSTEVRVQEGGGCVSLSVDKQAKLEMALVGSNRSAGICTWP